MMKTLKRRNIEAACAAPPSRDVAAALRALSDNDLLRLRALAHLRARALPAWLTWSDLLNEAILRALDGSRRWPDGVPLLAFLAGVMRSLCDEHWRRHQRERCLLPTGQADEDAAPAADPERLFAAAQGRAIISRLFAADPVALKIIAGLTDGLTAEEIRRLYGLDAVEYDTARRRMRRVLLRHGLAWFRP